MTTQHTTEKTDLYRILSLDGGGAKGFYTLGVLKEIEGMIGHRPLCEKFDLIFGTSTGAIIAALLALGYKVDDIYALYKEYVPTIMKRRTKRGKSEALANLAKQVFADAKFEDVKTAVGIVATRWIEERPMIFKASIAQAHGSHGTFAPGFGVPIGDAVQASCSAYPFFRRKTVTTSKDHKVELADGGFCANDPTLYAIADALLPLDKKPENIRVVSVGVGVYPKPKSMNVLKRFINALPSVKLLQKTLEINTQSMDQLRNILYKTIPTVRISETFERPEMATDFLEYDLDKLNVLLQRGAQSFAKEEARLREFLV